MGKTITEKIIAAASGLDAVSSGDLATVRVDLAVANDLTAPITVSQFHKAGAVTVFDPGKICITGGRHSPFKDVQFATMFSELKAYCESKGIERLYGLGEGMEHVILPEAGLVRPGMLVCIADSHASTAGALGALTIPMGSTDMAYIFAFGETWLRVPETILIRYRGKPPRYVTSKDFILAAVGRLGVDGARYRSIEFSGEAVKRLSMDERFTITNMAIEMGAKAGIIEPDAVTEEYLSSRTNIPYTEVRSDPDAQMKAVIDIDVSDMQPLAARPPLPSNVVPVAELRETKVTQVNIGSCTNGRMIDLRQAAEVLRGNKVARGVRLMVTPATAGIYRQAMKEGLLEIFADAGGIINAPGCGPCGGIHMGILSAGDVCMTTHNRNFRGRMGHKDADIYLASPYVAAATAVAGQIIDPREVAS